MALSSNIWGLCHDEPCWSLVFVWFLDAVAFYNCPWSLITTYECMVQHLPVILSVLFSSQCKDDNVGVLADTCNEWKKFIQLTKQMI